jgi:hypothetical protein
MFGRIFKFARSIVNGVLQQMTQQISSVENSVLSPLRNQVNLVLGGIWIGDGANRFVEEMTSDVIPLLLSIIGLNTSYADGIRKSMEIMDQAEKQASAKAQQLVDVFSSIF